MQSKLPFRAEILSTWAWVWPKNILRWKSALPFQHNYWKHQVLSTQFMIPYNLSSFLQNFWLHSFPVFLLGMQILPTNPCWLKCLLFFFLWPLSPFKHFLIFQDHFEFKFCLRSTWASFAPWFDFRQAPPVSCLIVLPIYLWTTSYSFDYCFTFLLYNSSF